MELPHSMHAMVLQAAGQPLIYKEVPLPSPGPNQVLIKVIACGICRTDLHIADGELPLSKLPLIPGHEVIGTVMQTGSETTTLKEGNTVGVPWLGYTCGQCRYCMRGQENLCDHAGFTGYTCNGGYAEYMVADSRFCFLLPANYANAESAPLLCAGLIGYRSYRMTGDHAKKIGIYGFGAAAHILIQLAKADGKVVFAFTRAGDTATQQFAITLGAYWAGDSTQPCPEPLDASIIFAPAGELVPKALLDTDKGGIVVCGGIHMSDIPAFPYKRLWQERVVRSVANLTRDDGIDFFKRIASIHVQTETHLYPLVQANKALNDLRMGTFQGAAVLIM